MQTSAASDLRPEPSAKAAILAAFRAPPAHWLDVGHTLLAYRSFGQGPDVVFVHGWPLHGATFRGVVAELADRFTCHIIDLPSTLYSRNTDRSPLDFGAYAATLRAAIDLLGLRRYGLVAHDSGALVARMLAAGDERAAGLVLGDTEIPGHHGWLIALLAALSRAPGGAALLRGVMSVPALRCSPLGFGGCFERAAHVNGEFAELFIEPLLASPEALDRHLAPVARLSPRLIDGLDALHGRIAAPVRLIWGTDDTLFPLRKARAMVGQFKGGAELHEIAGGRAFVHDERPGEFAALARPALARWLS